MNFDQVADAMAFSAHERTPAIVFAMKPLVGRIHDIFEIASFT